ncbi:hypothetical protein FACS1894191_4870 [Clostridia bacterium]|nr:hypothetical protein FACS1894191_4870 [Clostridia bacterium]
MNRKRLLDTFCELVAIDSPSLDERLMCEHLKKRLSGLGFELYEDGAGESIGGACGNLYGWLDGDESLEPLLFSAHMDTVEPARGKRAVLHADGSITSVGDTVLGADDASGIAAILEAVQSVRESGVRCGPIEVLFPVAEELYGLGSSVFDYSRIRSREAYVLDLTGRVGNAANKAPTILGFTAAVTGKAAHAGFASADGVHAIAAAAAAITRIPMGQVDDETTCNIGMIEGGAASNIVPDRCIVKGEIRSYSHEKALARAEAVKRELEAAAKALGGGAEVDVVCHIKAYETPAGHRVAARLEAACKALGLPFALHPTFGGSDNNNFARHGITGLVLSSAMEGCHSRDEHTSAEALESLAKLTAALMTGETGA